MSVQAGESFQEAFTEAIEEGDADEDHRLRPKWPSVIRINTAKAKLLYYGAART
jgi:hypothetical protein